MSRQNPKEHLTYWNLHTQFEYNPWDGVLRSKRTGKRVGGNRGVYRRVAVNGGVYLEHMVIWIMMTGRDPSNFDIDHRDRNKRNNCWFNLRKASRQQNNANMGAKNTTHGLKGVYKHRNGRFRSQIMVDYKSIHLGVFDTPEEAHAAYIAAAGHYFGEFSRAA